MRKRQKSPLPSVPRIALLVLLVRISIVLGQTTCNNGQGRVLYERLPNQQLQGFDDDVVRDTAPPFRVLEKCQDLCLRDRTASNNLVRACTSFDFQPGSRIASFSGSAEYEESTCYLTREQAAPEGIGNLMLVPNSVHFTEICLSSSRPERECPSRRYVFERHPRKKLKLPVSDIKEMTAANRTDCEDKCLNEFSFVCRSANYDSTLRMCSLSRYTRRTHPELLEDDPNSDYLENTCLNAERRCDGLIIFVKEENKRLGGPFEVDIFNNMTLDECQSMCMRAEKYFCRSVEYDDQTKQCILSEEDSISQKDDISISSSPTHNFYDLVCLDNQRGPDYPDNSVTSHLFSNGKKPDTAFQRYRNSRLGGEFHSEITGRSLSECLDECLRQTSFQCRSAVYSDRFRTCRLSRYSQRDGMRIIYDADYDYYENLMPNLVGQDGDGPNRGPQDHTDRWPGGGPHTDRDRYPGSGYPSTDRYPGTRPDYTSGPGSDRDRYPSMPGDRDRYPSMPGDRDRYPSMPGDRDRYPSMPGDRDRYPSMPGYPDTALDRYPYMPGGSYPSMPGYYPMDRYPTAPSRPAGPSRYPHEYDSRYPDYYPNDNRYPPIYDNRFPDDRYPDRGLPPRGYPDRGPQMFPDQRFPPSRGHPIGKYPPPLPPPSGRYPSEPSPFPGDYDNRIPPDYPYDSRYPPPHRGQYPSKYPDKDIPYSPTDKPGAPWDKYPSRAPASPREPPPPPYSARYPSHPGNRYPVSENRFPVGNDRYPTNIYKYGNRVPPSGPGYERYPDEYERGFGGNGPYLGIGIFGMPRPLHPGYPDRRGYARPPPAQPGSVGYRQQHQGYPYSPPQGYDNLGPGDGFGGLGPARPYVSRCEDSDVFKQMAARHRMRRQYVKRTLNAPSLTHCQRECVEARDFVCKSFNYREPSSNFEPTQADSANCELSDRDSKDLDVQSPLQFDTGNYDFYERSFGRNAIDQDCLDVSQVCNEEGMEFTLRTPEGFYGRIYTYGYYDRCFFRGNGASVNVLRITGANGYPECGTQRYGDTMTNIVVVQFSDNVQTGRDKRFNLTCLFRGPGESVVTSGYIGAGSYNDIDRSGSPIPIEYLPAENSLTNKVRLMILYQGRPTTTIAVGDPLTFRLEPQDGYTHPQELFATNVVARDPYSGRSVMLIDRYGCPVDSFVFPELGRARDGDGIEARFNAFKIPESNFLVFEATVRSCREGCIPAYCPGPAGRSDPSFGRRRRSLNGTVIADGGIIISDEGEDEIVVYPETNSTNPMINSTRREDLSNDLLEDEEKVDEFPEQVREMIEVFESREEMQLDSVARKVVAPQETVCLAPSEYHGMISAIILLMVLLLAIALGGGLAYRRYWAVYSKNLAVDRHSPTTFTPSALHHINVSTSQFNASRPGGLTLGHCSTTGRSSRVSLFNGGLQKTFATGNLARMCQLPVMNPIRNGNTGEFEDPSEPIYTDPSLFERSRSLRSINEESKSE